VAEAPGKKKKLVKGRHLSAIKRHRQSEKRAIQNTHFKSTFRTLIKKVMAAVEKKDKQVAGELLKSVTSHLHKAKRRNILHANNISHKIGRLSKQVASISS
jgi:small subunit ribosomal protein S20